MRTAFTIQLLMGMICFNPLIHTTRVFIADWGTITAELSVRACEDFSREGRKSATISMQVERDVIRTTVDKLENAASALFSFIVGMTFKVPITCGLSLVSGPMEAYKKLKSMNSVYKLLLESRASKNNGSASEVTDITENAHNMVGLNSKRNPRITKYSLLVGFDFADEFKNNMKISKFVLALEQRYGSFNIRWKVLENERINDFREYIEGRGCRSGHSRFINLSNFRDISKFASKQSPVVVLRATLTHQRGQKGSKKFRPRNLLTAAISADPIKA